MVKILQWVISLLIIGGILALVVVYNKDITKFSTQFLAGKDGEQAMANEDWGRALKIYEKAYQEDKTDSDAALRLAEVKHQLIENYADKGWVDAHIEDASGEMKHERYSVKKMRSEADSLFRKVIQAHPKDLQGRLAYGRFLHDSPNRLGEGVKIYQQALAHHDDSPVLMAALGDTFKKAAENPRETRPEIKNWLFDWAVYYYRLSLKMEPQQFQPRFNLGVIYHTHQSQKRAEREVHLVRATRSYCNALSMQPESYEARYNMGLVLVDLKAVDPGFRQLNYAAKILSDQDRVLEAQQLIQQIQSVRNDIYYDDPQLQLKLEDMEPWMKDCLQRFKVGV